MSIQTKRTSTLYGVLPGWVRAQSFCKIWLIHLGGFPTYVRKFQPIKCVWSPVTVCKNGPRDLTMNSSDENYFQTNTRTFVLFRINTLPRPAPCSQLPTRSGGANRQCLFSIHLYTCVYNSCTRRRIL